MKPWRWILLQRWLGVAVCGSAAASLCGCVSSYDFAKLQANRELLRGDNEVLTQQVAELQGRVKRLESDLEAKRREAQALRETHEALVADLQSELATGQVEIEQLRDGLRVQLAEDILFAPGRTELAASGIALLERVAVQLEGTTHRIDVQGHTDDVAIGPGLAARYPTNWELAGARAAGVVRLFEGRGIESARLSAVSFGASRPVATNADAAGRARNRRIEIRLIPVAGERLTEAAEGTPAVPADPEEGTESTGPAQATEPEESYERPAERGAEPATAAPTR